MLSSLFHLNNAYDVYEFLIRIPIVLFSLTVHEVAHGFAAYKLGDPTAKSLGRLSLNPLKHLDPAGAICMLLFRFGWAKPVPINTRYFKKPRSGMALTALAGPVSNLLMSLVAFIISRYIYALGGAALFSDSVTPLQLLCIFFDTFFLMNLCLAVFNLIPVPPLDGSRILLVFLPDKLYFGIMRYEQYIYIGLIVCLFLGILDVPLNFIVDLFLRLFYWLSGLLPLL